MTQIKRKCGLQYWMAKTSHEYVRAQKSPNPSVIHDLRVALRRVRTLAETLAQNRPQPSLEAVQTLLKPLFRGIAQLRNNQVLQERLRQLAPKNDPGTVKLLRILKSEEIPLRRAVRKKLAGFDLRKWKQLTRSVSRPEHIRGAGRTICAEWAALRLERVKQLHQKVLSKPSRKNYHRLRVAFKKYRYLLENLLPDRYRASAKILKAVQDALGNYHDLEMLRAFLREQRGHLSPSERRTLKRNIRKEQKRNLRIYHALVSGRTLRRT